MAFGRGRTAKSPTILEVAELAPSDLDGLERGAMHPVKRFRDSHHAVARLFAAGLRPGEVAEASGYSLNRVSVLSADPQFQELIIHYRATVTEAFADGVMEYAQRQISVRNKTLRMMEDQLDKADENDEDVPLNTLLRIHDSQADRTGFGKRSTVVNINADFAARLERAIKESKKVIEAKPMKVVNG